MLSRQILVFAMAIALTVGAAGALLYLFAPAKKRIRRKPSIAPLYANIVWGIIGLLLYSFAIGLFSTSLNSYSSSRSWPEVEATVTYFLYVPAKDDDDSSALTVRVSYNYKGQEYRNIDLPSSDSHMYEGQRLAVRVNPDDPERLYRDSMAIWVICAVLFAFGFALCTLDLVGLRRQRLQSKASGGGALTKAERWGNDKATGAPIMRRKILLFPATAAALVALYIVSLKNNELAAHIFIASVLLIIFISLLLQQLAVIRGLIGVARLLLGHAKEILAQRRDGKSWGEILRILKVQADDINMQWPSLYGPKNQPTAPELQTHVSSPLWDNLADHLQQTYRVQPALVYSNTAGEEDFYHGWHVNYKKSGKPLCTLYPKPGFFVARIHISNKEKQEAEQLLRTCDTYTRKCYRNTPQKNNGKSLCLEVTTEAILRDAKALIALRAGFAQNKSHPA